jgi:protein SCO1
MRNRGTLILLFMVVIPVGLRAEDPLPNILRDVGIDQRLDEQVPLDLVFRDETGKTVRLGEYFDGKPVILVLAYYRCPMLCNQVLNGLVDGLRGVPLVMGEQYRVVTVSIDAREKPELAAAKKVNYALSYGGPGTADGWHFLTGEQEPIDQLSRAVGFRYRYDAEQDQFAHGSGIMVLTPQGKIAHYFLGIRYSPRDLRLALVEASAGKIGSPVDQLLLLCYHYDPTSGKYSLAVMSLIRLGGVLTLVILGAFLARVWYQERRRNRGKWLVASENQ